MSKKVLVPVAEGTEEMEAVIAIDLFRRAGIQVLVAGTALQIKCSRSVTLVPDILLEDVEEEFDMIYLPGGGLGTKNLMNNDHLRKILTNHYNSNKSIAAICAATLILKEFKILKPKTKITSHPSVKNNLKDYNYVDQEIVVDKGIFTSRGAGTAIPFSLFLIEKLIDKHTSSNISESIIYKDNASQYVS